MIDLSFDDLRLIAQITNISDYENKSKEVLIKSTQQIKTRNKSRIKTRNKTKTNTKTRIKTRNRS